MTKSLEKNWTNLKLMYGTRTGLNLWVDYRQYTTMAFSLDAPLTQQIDEMSELRNRIVNTGLVIRFTPSMSFKPFQRPMR